jgi:sulfide:quinone oxidoreductase
MEKDLKRMVDAVELELRSHGVSRRDAIKMAAVGSSEFLLGSGSKAEAATAAYASDAKGKILIVGKCRSSLLSKPMTQYGMLSGRA